MKALFVMTNQDKNRTLKAAAPAAAEAAASQALFCP